MEIINKEITTEIEGKEISFTGVFLKLSNGEIVSLPEGSEDSYRLKTILMEEYFDGEVERFVEDNKENLNSLIEARKNSLIKEVKEKADSIFDLERIKYDVMECYAEEFVDNGFNLEELVRRSINNATEDFYNIL